MKRPSHIVLWMFSAGDFERWREICHRDGPIKTHDQYIEQIEAIATDARGKGIKVIRRRIKVDDMLSALARRGMANTSQNRSRVLVRHRGDGPVLGLKVGANPGSLTGSLGWALVGQSGETTIGPNESHADASRRVIDRL